MGMREAEMSHRGTQEDKDMEVGQQVLCLVFYVEVSV